MQTRRLLLPKWRLHRPNPDATPPSLCRPRRLSAADAAQEPRTEWQNPPLLLLLGRPFCKPERGVQLLQAAVLRAAGAGIPRTLPPAAATREFTAPLQISLPPAAAATRRDC